MPKVTIERKKNMASVARRNLAPGAVFSLVKRDGTVGRKQYMAIGNNGRWLSINLATGQLASTSNSGKKVTVVGKGKFRFNRWGSYKHAETTRGRVQSNQLFQVRDGGKTYAALGKFNDGRFCGVNIADPQSGDYAAGDDSKKNVTVVGDYTIAVEVAA